MPGLDKTGPTGQGSQTGRKLGACTTENSTITEDTPRRKRVGREFRNRHTSESEAFFQRGRGMRNGFRRGRGGKSGVTDLN